MTDQECECCDDIDVGAVCDCGCCQSCCNCTPNDCDCAACIERRENEGYQATYDLWNKER